MQLTMFSDFALRVLMFTHAAGDRLVTIDEISAAYDNTLTRAGYLTAVRGRSGGLRLAMPAEDINLGRVVRTTEPDFALVECFSSGNQCVITGCCKLQGVLGEALKAFLAVLDRYTLASIALKPRDFRNLFEAAT
jgi:Rrf2 family nitric oxide-sensitive transcriptional repressor